METAKNFTENAGARRSMRIAAAFLLFRRSNLQDTQNKTAEAVQCGCADNESVSDSYVCAARAGVMCLLACWGFQKDVDHLLTEEDVSLAKCRTDKKCKCRGAYLRKIVAFSRAFYEKCNAYLLHRDLFRIASVVGALLPFGIAWCEGETTAPALDQLREANVGFIAATVVCPDRCEVFEGEGAHAKRPRKRLAMARQIAHAFGAEEGQWPVLCPTTLLDAACTFCCNVSQSMRSEQHPFHFAECCDGAPLRTHEFMHWIWGSALANAFSVTVHRKNPAVARRPARARLAGEMSAQ